MVLVQVSKKVKRSTWTTFCDRDIDMEFNSYNMGICRYACYKGVRKEPFKIGEYYGS